MMKNGICPKCESTEVYAGAFLPGFTKAGSNWANTIPITMWFNAYLDNYVCANCGYVESYVSDRAKLAKIVQKWPKAGEVSPQFDALGARRPSSGRVRVCPQCGSSLQGDWRACPYCGQMMV